MKSLPDNSLQKPPARRMAACAFTLAEMMTTVAIFSMVVIGMVSLQIFGFKMNSFTSSKLISTAYSLKILNQIRDQVRGANLVQVGNWDGALFTTTGTNGNALQIYPTTNLANYLCFYLDTNTTRLYKLDNAGADPPIMLASNIINQTIFQMEDFRGNSIVSGSTEHYTIQMTLQFLQLDYQVPTNVYENYILQTLMTPRTQN
jgi:hypothetical protein